MNSEAKNIFRVINNFRIKSVLKKVRMHLKDGWNSKFSCYKMLLWEILRNMYSRKFLRKIFHLLLPVKRKVWLRKGLTWLNIKMKIQSLIFSSLRKAWITLLTIILRCPRSIPLKHLTKVSFRKGQELRKLRKTSIILWVKLKNPL